MRIAVDISPIIAGSGNAHKVRGVGKYITLLRDNLARFDKKNSYNFVSNPSQISADLVHYPYFDPFFVTLPYINKIKTVVTIHDVIPLAHRNQFPIGAKGNFKWMINKMLVKKANGILTDSNASKEEIYRVIGVERRKIHPVHLAVDDDFKHLGLSFQQKKDFLDRYNLPQEFALYVGDVTWNKNLPRLVDAAIKANVPFVLVGKALNEEKFDRKNAWNRDRMIVQMKINGNDLFHKMGFMQTSDLVKLYNCASFLCMPSLDEGFGLPALEAMTCGCPVVISQFGSLPEVGGDAAIYVDAEDVEEMASVMRQTFTDKKLLNELSKKSLVQASKFSLEKMIKDTVTVYESYQ